MRAANGWRSRSRFGWLVAGVWAAVLTAVLAPVALAQSPGLEPPERPQGLRAEVSHDAVSLSWDDPGDASISGYQILRRDRDLSPVGVFEVLVEDTGSAAAAYADRQVQPETRYNYRVKARNAAGLSRRSNFVRADTPAAPEEAIEEALKKAIEALPEEAVTVWTGQLTVGVFAAAAPPVAGYAGWTRQGALSPDSFWFDKKEYTVLGLLEHGGGLNLVLGRPLPHDFVLELGARRYESGASLEPVFVWAGRYWWPDDAIGWAAGDELTVSIVLDPSTTASERALAPPSAYLTEAPAAHNGSDAFSLRLIFDESGLPLSAALLRDHALQVSGGSVLAVDQGRRDSDWLITLQPDGDGPLTVSLPSPADCADAGAVCSADGRKLRGRLTATIAGPPQLAALQIVGATLSPAFDPATELFTAAAETGLEQVTVVAAADRPSAQLTIRPADADPQQAGHQIALAAAGETTLELELKSLTGETARVYWVVLRRSAAAPEAPSSGLNALRFSGLPALEFSEHESRFELDAPEDLEETTVIVSRAESEAGVDIFSVRGDELVVNEADHDPNAPGHQTLLSEWGDTLLLVRVTSGDGRSQRAYVTRLRGDVETETAPPAVRSETRSAPRKPASSGARDDDVPTLSALSLSGADLTPAFASGAYIYEASVAADLAQVTITATPAAAGATLLLIIPADADPALTGHQVSLGAAGSETTIVVVVSNAAGQLNSYLLTVLRELPATPTTLQSLVVEGHELSPAFAAAVPLYSVDVGANVSDVTLTALTAAATATLTFVPADADPATPGYQVALGSPGAQTTTSIVIIISAPGAAAHTTYVVNITRAASDPTDAALSSLSVDGYGLTPAFDAETYGYALTVPGAQDTISLHAVSRSLSAGLSVSPPDADPLEPGYQIPLAAVEPGAEPSLTTVTVTVTSEDLATTQTYTISVTRTAAPTGGFKFIEVGWSFACAIRIDGTPACWSYDVPIEADHGPHVTSAPVDTQPQGGVLIELTAAIDKVCAVRPDGQAFCWGETPSSSITPRGPGTMTQQTGAGPLIDKFTYYNGIRLMADGSVRSPGSSVPENLKAGPYQAVAAARDIGCALDFDGHIKCWKWARKLFNPTPTVEYKYINAGGTTVCGIKADDSTLHCWDVDRQSAVLNEPGGAFRSVDAAYHQTFCGLKVDGTVECFWGAVPGHDPGGANAGSRLARGFPWDSEAEYYAQRHQKIAALNEAPEEDTLGYTMVAMDRVSFACGLRTDSSIACWGWDNEYLASLLPPFESPWHDSPLLVDLTVDNGALLPEFDRDVTEYELSVDNATSTITLTPEVTNLFANYAISADTDATVIDDTVDLSLGANVVTITVTAADGVTTRDYTVTVTRAAAN